MTTSPLLSNVRHRAMITPASPLRNKAVESALMFQAPAPGINSKFWLQHLEAFGSGFRTIWSKQSEKNIKLFV